MSDDVHIRLTEQLAQGRALRQQCSRQDQALVRLAPQRDVLTILQESSRNRVPALVPVRYGRMLASPFAFFRGVAALQAADLAAQPVSGLRHQICGDAHLMNFGFFASPERQLMFDLNDFDETHPGPWEWDLKRLLVSIVLAARLRGIPDTTAGDMVLQAVQTYQNHLFRHANMSALEVWYDRLTVETLESISGEDAALKRRFAKLAESAKKRTNEGLLPKITAISGDSLHLKDDPPRVFHLHAHDSLLEDDDEWFAAEHWEQLIGPMFTEYLSTLQPDRRVLLERFRRVDLAFKVVGVGSVGTRCLVLLLQDDYDQPLFLQLKEANASVLARYTEHKRCLHDGERVVSGQRLMQAASDPFLGFCTCEAKRHFYVRQLRDMKASVALETFGADEMEAYARVCARTLARAHARAGGLAAQMAGYIGKSGRYAELMNAYTLAYADQVEADYQLFKQAVRIGHLKASEG